MKLALSLLCASLALAQPAFDVTSVKPSAPDQPGMNMSQTVGRVVLQNATLRWAIETAYGLQDWQLAGGPKWADSEHFDMEGKCPGDTKQSQIFEMLKTLLAERFQLKFHRQTRETSAYALLPAKNGLKLPKAKDPDAPSNWSSGDTMASGKSMTTAGLAEVLSRSLGRPVVDETGSKDVFDFKISWASKNEEPVASLFAVLQEQLGVRLEARRVPVEMFVIESAERPAAN